MASRDPEDGTEGHPHNLRLSVPTGFHLILDWVRGKDMSQDFIDDMSSQIISQCQTGDYFRIAMCPNQVFLFDHDTGGYFMYNPSSHRKQYLVEDKSRPWLSGAIDQIKERSGYNDVLRLRKLIENPDDSP
jgi:hypothetical protein